MSNSEPKFKPPVSNGVPPPSFPLPVPDGPEDITSTLLLLLGQTKNPRHRFLYKKIAKHLHTFVNETNLTTDEWKTGVDFLTRAGVEDKMITLSGLWGVNALVDAINSPVDWGATDHSHLGPFYADDAEDIPFGESIASEGKGDYMYVEGRVLTTDGEPIADALIETWEADRHGFYDLQYAGRDRPDCRGRVRTGKDGKFGYRAVIPGAYGVPADGTLGELLLSQGRHNMRPAHLHMMVEAPGYHKLVTALYMEDCVYLTNDAAFGVKKSLVAKLEKIDDEAEARKRGFPNGSSFTLLKHDLVLVTDEQLHSLQQQALQKLEELQDKDD